MYPSVIELDISGVTIILSIGYLLLYVMMLVVFLLLRMALFQRFDIKLHPKTQPLLWTINKAVAVLLTAGAILLSMSIKIGITGESYFGFAIQFV